MKIISGLLKHLGLAPAFDHDDVDRALEENIKYDGDAVSRAATLATESSQRVGSAQTKLRASIRSNLSAFSDFDLLIHGDRRRAHK